MAVHRTRSSNFLLVRAAGVHLLLDCAGILEIVEVETLASSERGFLEWREQVVASIPVAQFFGLGDTPGRLGIAYRPADDQPPVLLQVCEVLWLREINRSAWIPVPSLPVESARYFDAIAQIDGSVHQAYRLRRPLSRDAFVNPREAV